MLSVHFVVGCDFVCLGILLLLLFSHCAGIIFCIVAAIASLAINIPMYFNCGCSETPLSILVRDLHVSITLKNV
jgi:predicted RND superfamily exporter protein